MRSLRSSKIPLNSEQVIFKTDHLSLKKSTIVRQLNSTLMPYLLGGLITGKQIALVELMVRSFLNRSNLKQLKTVSFLLGNSNFKAFLMDYSIIIRLKRANKMKRI
jgi:hypothetical protein